MYGKIFKLEAFLRAVNDGMSCRSSANNIGTESEHVHRWVMRYKQYGTKGLFMKYDSYDGKFKLSVVEYMHHNHLSLSQTAIKFDVPTDVTVDQ